LPQTKNVEAKAHHLSMYRGGEVLAALH
jgi:hypothetical protein